MAIAIHSEKYYRQFEAQLWIARKLASTIEARLSDLAKKGGVLIGEEPARLIEGLWPFYDREKVSL
jgi:hypothetical protein